MNEESKFEMLNIDIKEELEVDETLLQNETTFIKCEDIKYELESVKEESNEIEEVLKCANCEYETKCKQSFQKHIDYCLLRTCTKCSFTTNIQDVFKKHLIDHEIEESNDMEVKIEDDDYRITINDLNTIFNSNEKNSLTCYNCEYKASNIGDLKSHKKQCLMRKCSKCSFKTNNRIVFIKHKLEHEAEKGIKVYFCTECDYSIKNKYKYKEHYRTHLKKARKNLYKCTKCNFVSKWSRSYKTHLKTCLNPNKDLKTEEVDVASATEPNLENKNDELLKCANCEYETKYKQNLKRHMENCLLKTCSKCSFTTGIHRLFKKHLLDHEIEEGTRVYSCKQCSYVTKSSSNLKEHSIIHKKVGDVPIHTCNICGFETKWYRSFKKHKKCLMKVEPCDKCSFVSDSSAMLRRHKWKHEEENGMKVYYCGECPYATKSHAWYKNHVASHQGRNKVDGNSSENQSPTVAPLSQPSFEDSFSGD